MQQKFLSYLVETKILTQSDVDKIVKDNKDSKSFIVQNILAAFPEQSNAILKAYSHTYQGQVADLASMDIPSNIIDLIPREVATQSKVIPIDRAGNNIIIASLNPHDIQLVDHIRFKTGYTAKPVLAVAHQLEKALSKYYKMKDVGITEVVKKTTNKKTEGRHIIQAKGNDPIVTLVNQILLQCVHRNASDIHIEPYETFLRVRLRIDGKLKEISRPPISIASNLTSRIKIMANMKIEERRLPQDGPINSVIDNKNIDFRVNTLPVSHGEKIVLRILDKSALNVDLTKLGFEPDDFDKFKDTIHNPYGMVLVTGPTGSGKTTTLYSALQELNTVDSNLMTAEDPVEFNLDGINQVQVDPSIGFSFAKALKAFLRQDPDIIMVGEIRDKETGEIAIKAALTGHMVLSTLHTNTAPDTITRLLDMGLEPFNIISSLNSIIAQRLVRRLCNLCKKEIGPDAKKALEEYSIPKKILESTPIFEARGCDQCSDSGYSGRTAVHEVLVLNDAIRQSVMAGANSVELKSLARKSGMRTLRQNALLKLLRGETDLLEVISNTASDEN